MKLTRQESTSALWIKVRDHMEERLTELRRKNDGEYDPIQTAKLRGRIHELRNLLELDQPEPAQVAEYGADE